jgi:hypothetical protein
MEMDKTKFIAESKDVRYINKPIFKIQMSLDVTPCRFVNAYPRVGRVCLLLDC